MTEFVNGVAVIAQALLALTLVSSAVHAWRRRDRHRLDVFALVAALFLTKWGAQWDLVKYSFILAQPYLLVRLLKHSRDVPAAVEWATAALMAASPVAQVLYGDVSATWRTLFLFMVAFHAYVAVAFLSDARRTGGVTARRLRFVAIGAVSWTGSVLAMEYGSVLNATERYDLSRLLYYIALISYYFGFATPRWLKTTWQNREQAAYLSQTAERDPEDRGQRVPEDLTRGVRTSIGGSATVVALRETPAASDLVIKGATDSRLLDLHVAATSGGAMHAALAGSAKFSTPDRCEPEVASRLARHGIRVLVAPIASPSQAWGVVLVVQRRGSLFPDDDLRLLAQLGRYAGTALDHAHLVADARERERRAADRRLREAESRMSLMLDSIKDYAMYVLDDHGRVVNWHIGAEHVFGYDAREMLDEPAAPLYDVERATFDSWLMEARALGFVEAETMCCKKDGGKFVGATVIRPLADDGEGLSGFVGVTRDVTERRELELRLRQSQKMEAIGQLAGGIAHDFNNMLTAIIGYGEFLKMELAHDEQSLDRVNEILTAAQRAAGLTRSLLAFSRRQLLQPLPLNLGRVISEMLPMLRQVIGAHVVVVDDLAAELPTVLGDRSQIEQIVVNLSVNARDAMPSGGRLTLRLSRTWLDESTVGELVEPGLHVLLEVADTGVGMDEATQARIFEPFFTTKEFGRGTGLGLSTVYGIVKQMGGFLRLASQPGQGTTFRLYFPAARTAQPPAVAKPPSRLSTGSGTLLVVEDEASIRGFLEQALRAQGYTVIAAENQAAALARAQAHSGPIDLVVADVVMPGGTGPELVRALGEIRPGVPALYISGYADAVMQTEGGFPKAAHFLQKPFSAADLLARIRQILVRA